MPAQRVCLDQLRPASFAFRAAIFDFDGTLADSCDVWAQVDRDFFAARGLAYSPEYAETLALLGFEDGARYTVEAYGLAESPQEICDEWNRMGREHYTHDVQMFPDALEYVRALKQQGILTAIATTNDPQVVSSMELRGRTSHQGASRHLLGGRTPSGRRAARVRRLRGPSHGHSHGTGGGHGMRGPCQRPSHAANGRNPGASGRHYYIVE